MIQDKEQETMDEKLMPNQFITGEPEVSANPQYLQWIEGVKAASKREQCRARMSIAEREQAR